MTHLSSTSIEPTPNDLSQCSESGSIAPPSVPADLPLVLTVSQLGAILQIGRNTSYALVQSGAIRSIRIGKNIRIPRDALMEYLRQDFLSA